MAADNTEIPKPKAGDACRFWLELPDAELLRQCQVDTYRASGPGGQKRNKTSSAVRLRHGPTGAIVVATESRSQHENRARALRRLRETLALTHRQTVDPADELPAFLAEALRRSQGLRMNRRHPDYFRVIQYILDLLLACQGRIRDVADRLGISSGQLLRFFRADTKLWTQVNRVRDMCGLHPLT